MTSIGPKAPITPPALPSEKVTPVNPVTEHHTQDDRGRDPKKPAEHQEVSDEQATPQPTLDPEAAIREHYARIQQLSPQEMVGYVNALRGVRTL